MLPSCTSPFTWTAVYSAGPVRFGLPLGLLNYCRPGFVKNRSPWRLYIWIGQHKFFAYQGLQIVIRLDKTAQSPYSSPIGIEFIQGQAVFVICPAEIAEFAIKFGHNFASHRNPYPIFNRYIRSVKTQGPVIGDSVDDIAPNKL